MIRSENILKVIENFKKVLPMAKQDNQLNMAAALVSEVGCGTVHCHAGWYAVAACPRGEYIGWNNGAEKMSKDLGFRNKEELKAWAGGNKQIWGTKMTYGMFCDEMAFEHPAKRPEGAKNLQHIIDHWTEVYERVRALEQSQNTVSKEPEAQECDATEAGEKRERWVHNPKKIISEVGFTPEKVDVKMETVLTP